METLEKCGRRKQSAAARIRTTLCAKVARRKQRSQGGPSVQQVRRKNQTRSKFASGTLKGWEFGKKGRVDLEGSTGVKDPITRRRLKNEKRAGRIFEAFRLQIAKRKDGSSVRLLQIRNLKLWRGRHPPKR
jgi:hypothetical protein